VHPPPVESIYLALLMLVRMSTRLLKRNDSISRLKRNNTLHCSIMPWYSLSVVATISLILSELLPFCHCLEANGIMHGVLIIVATFIRKCIHKEDNKEELSSVVWKEPCGDTSHPFWGWRSHWRTVFPSFRGGVYTRGV
jgi:hypothetical protein